mmetsp:Transcript_53658/g.105856  ORF Transcript_53658/g.105856 Transcript_53658/m.105856 type:complete len:656 (+) Transcript_53658:110-2077(+)
MTSTFLRDRLSACFAIEECKLDLIVAQLVESTKDMKLNKLTIQPIFKKIRKSCPKSNLPEMNTLLKCCYVLILSLRENYLLLNNVQDLCADYPEFIGLPVEELTKLLDFRNAMKISLQLIEAKHHKGELLEICGRLSGKLVTTGGSQTKETKRRVMIYEREGGLEDCDAKKTYRKRQVEEVKEEPCDLAKRVKLEKIAPPSYVPLQCPISAPVMIKSELLCLPDEVVSFLNQQLGKSFCPADAHSYTMIIQKALIQTTEGKELNKLTLRPVMKELRKLFPRKEIWTEMNILFKSCYVLILSLRDDSLMWHEPSMLIQAYPYPEFADLTHVEAKKLLLFRNAMKLSLQLIEAKHHKGELLEVAGRLSGRVVTTGGGQTIDTTRCVMIYEQEGGISGARKQKISTRTSSLKKRDFNHHPQGQLQEAGKSDGCLLLQDVDQYMVGGSVSGEDAWGDLIRASSFQRTGTDFSILSATFSLQSSGLDRLSSIGNLADLLNMPITHNAPTALVPDDYALSTATTMVAGALSVAQIAADPTAQTADTPSMAVGGGRSPEIPTDIDTELDSVEVATEVDDNEVCEDDNIEDGVEGGVEDERTRDALELQELLRTQSVSLQDLQERRNHTYGELLRAGSLAGGMIDLNIGRVGTINAEVFNWSQ